MYIKLISKDSGEYTLHRVFKSGGTSSMAGILKDKDYYKIGKYSYYVKIDKDTGAVISNRIDPNNYRRDDKFDVEYFNDAQVDMFCARASAKYS